MTPPEPGRPPRADALGVHTPRAAGDAGPLRGALALLLAAGLAMAPALGADDLWGSYLGSPTPDLYDHIFLFDWFADRLAMGELWPTHTQLLRGPLGGDIVMPDPLGGWLFFLLRTALPGPAAFNAALLLAIGLGAAAAAWLARRLGASPGGQVLAGALYGGSAYAWAQVHNGETETLQLAALPLCLAALHFAHGRIVAGSAPLRAGALAGACLGLSFLACWYYAAYALMIAAGGALFVTSPRLWRDKHPRGALAVAVGAATAAALIAPQALVLDAALKSAGSLFVMPDVLEVLSTDYLALGASSADLARLVAPGPPAAAGYLHSGHLGAVALALAAAGLLVAPRAARGWALLGALFMLLALGPHLYVAGEPVALAGAPVELPYLALSSALPFFGSMRLPYRCLVVVQLCIGLVAGLGIRALRPPWAPDLLLGAALSVVFLADGALFSGVPMPPLGVQVAPHPAAALVKPGEGVLDLPLRFGDPDLRGLYVAQQTTRDGFTPLSLMSSQLSWQLATNSFVVLAASADPHHRRLPMAARPGTAHAALAARVEAALYDAPPSPNAADVGLQDLKRQGIMWITLHRAALPGDDSEHLIELLSRHLGAPASDTEEALIYALR